MNFLVIRVRMLETNFSHTLAPRFYMPTACDMASLVIEERKCFMSWFLAIIGKNGKEWKKNVEKDVNYKKKSIWQC